MADFTATLAAQARAPRVSLTPELDAALAELDAALQALANELQVEYHGPGVGVEGERGVYRLAVRAHQEGYSDPQWSLRVCDALPNAGWRVAWAIQNVARLRKAAVVQSLPAFFAGYLAAVGEAGRADTPAGRRLAALAEAFGQTDTVH
ncbi:hypothetical protein HUS23_01830 [Ectothiorhodospiraceae bacterium 2226]|nr:hypothetical protein HUS23_01830 [Ectothiorhodospiraceae bacterium 2226]